MKHFFQSDFDYHQSAIAYVALIVYESACSVISDGNIADQSEEFLFYLLNIAREKNFDIGTRNTIGMYANIVQEENEEMLKYR